MNLKIMYIIFYVLIIFAIGIMVMEYNEIKEYMVVCKEYNNKMKQNENTSPININITIPGGLK